jgi:hypothetical protein
MKKHCDYTRPGVEAWWSARPAEVHAQGSDDAACGCADH